MTLTNTTSRLGFRCIDDFNSNGPHRIRLRHSDPLLADMRMMEEGRGPSLLLALDAGSGRGPGGAGRWLWSLALERWLGKPPRSTNLHLVSALEGVKRHLERGPRAQPAKMVGRGTPARWSIRPRKPRRRPLSAGAWPGFASCPDVLVRLRRSHRKAKLRRSGGDVILIDKRNTRLPSGGHR